MPISIINLKGTNYAVAVDYDSTISIKMPTESLLLGVEATVVQGTPCKISAYIRNTGTTQVCHVPADQIGPAQLIGGDMKIPMTDQQELVIDFYGVKETDVCWAKAVFFTGKTERIWWK